MTSMVRAMRQSLAMTALLLPSASTAKLVLDGGDAGWSSAWGTSVDGVMGGKSSIAVSFDDGMRATGYLNTDGGGFAGCWRNVAAPVDVSSYAGVAVPYAALDASAPPLALQSAQQPATAVSYTHLTQPTKRIV